MVAHKSFIMKRIHLLFASVFVVLLISGCSHRLSPEEFIRWVETPTDELYQSLEWNGQMLTLSFVPAEYQVLLSKRGEMLDAEQTQDLLEEYERHWYFKLKIRDPDTFLEPFYRLGWPEMLVARYLTSGIQKDLKLKIDGVEMPCIHSHCEARLLDGSSTLTLVFPRPSSIAPDTEHEVTLTPSGLPEASFKLNAQAYQNLPELKLI